MVALIMVTSLLLLSCVPDSCGKKVSFSTIFNCKGRMMHASIPEIQDGDDSTCFVMHRCSTTLYNVRTLRVTLNDASNISLIRIAAEPQPDTVYYLPLNGQPFIMGPNSTTGNVQEYEVQPGAQIHSLDIMSNGKVCEVTMFDTEHETEAATTTTEVEDTQKGEENGINLALYIGVPTAAVFLLSIIVLLVCLKRRNTADKTNRKDNKREVPFTDEDGTKRSGATMYLRENAKLDHVRVPVIYEEIRPISTASSHEYMRILWDRGDNG
ncbi:uncharacterized protein LOC135399070 [Ornithodoros turicata]|uniref:uncharacterized protein LOC135399070 n=1 Tax=Ornithodoros turicata TaxID=34597 RepID=UPI003139E431